MATIIEKLPLVWKDFKSFLKHKIKEMSLEDLIIWQGKVEEGNKNIGKKSGFSVAKTNVMEYY